MSYFPNISAKLIKFALLLIIALPFQIHAQKKEYQGLLWEISGNGLKKPSYLYGTMHVSNRIAFHLSDRFFNAIKNSDMVALEINPETLFQDFLSSPILTATQNYTDLKNKNFYKTAFNTPYPENKSIAELLALESDFANYMLYRSEFNRENFEENTYLDLYIYQTGKKLNKKVFGLEDVNTTLELSLQASIPDEDEEFIYSYQDAQSNLQLIEDAYRKGNLDLIDSLSQKESSRKYREYMLFKRNIIMADRMDSIIRSSVSLFTGIGAAHLPGEKGVIELLRAKGYTVKPLSKEGEGLKMKEKIEKITFKLPHTNQYSADSTIQYSSPGALTGSSFINQMHTGTETRSINYRELFYPEMVNGAYYSIYRINTYAPLYGKNQKTIKAKIDSLLFENIPGKILKKKYSAEAGNEVIDITSKTRRGDLNRYKIIITPLEIIIFKMAGGKDYMEKESEKFFSSIKLQARSVKEIYKPDYGLFSIYIPGEKVIEVNSGKTAPTVIQSFDRTKNTYYLFARTVFNDVDYIEEDNFELEYLARNFYRQFNMEPVEKKFLEFQKHPAVLYKLKNKEQSLNLMLVIDGPNYYLLACSGSEEEASEYFNSLQILKPVYQEKSKSFRDTLYHYTVNTPVEPEGQGLFHLMEQKVRKNQDKFEGKKQSIPFINNETGELIKVDYEKFHHFKGYKNQEEFWKKVIANATNNGSLIVKEKHGPEMNKLSLVLTDTNSVRAILKTFILTEGQLYTLSANYDLLSGQSAFIKNFFESFQATPDSSGPALFENKTEKFFQVISKGDSTEIEQVFYARHLIEFANQDAPGIVGLLGKMDFRKHFKNYTQKKVQLISSLGKLHHPTVIRYLKNEYRACGDTVTYQIAILKALAANKTKESYNTILSLLNDEVPLTREYEVKSLFNQVADTLELAALLFPDVIKFIRYKEYKSSIYSLLSELVDKGLISKSALAVYKSEILRDANEELKRVSGIEASKNNSGSYENNYYDFEYDEDYAFEYDYEYEYEEDNDYSLKENLEVYATILLPFYSEKDTDAFYTKLATLKNESLLLKINILLAKNNLPVNDTIWHFYASNNTYRIYLIETLGKLNKLSLIPDEFLAQEHIVKGILYRNTVISDKDSVVFLEKKKVTVEGKEGFIYFYKRKKEKSKEWKLDYTGLQPIDNNKYQIDKPLVTRTSRSIKQDDVSATIEEVVEELALKNRKRARAYPSFSNFTGY